MGEWIALSLGVLILLAIAARSLVKLVRDYERALLFSRGRFRRELGPGFHLVLWPLQSVVVMDARSTILALAGQEILSADNVSVKATLALRLHIASAQLAFQSAQSYKEALYLEAQLALRDIVGRISIEEFLEKREEMAAALRERLEPVAARLGVALETVGIKDIMFPPNLRQTFARVVEARKGAQAAIERARGETATLRHLANAARLLDGNPALVTLKTLDLATDGKHTFVFGAGSPLLPVGEAERRPPAAGPEAPESESPEQG